MTTTAVTTYQYRTSRVAVGTFFLLLGASFLLDSMGVFRVTAALFWPLFVIAWGAGLLLHRARRLQVEEDRSAQLAVAEERVRIARELHDIVAHGVSLMTIQIAAESRTSVAVTGLPFDHLAPDWRCTVTRVPSGDTVQEEARPGSSWFGLAAVPAFQASSIESKLGNTLLVALNGFIGAPGVISVT